MLDSKLCVIIFQNLSCQHAWTIFITIFQIIHQLFIALIINIILIIIWLILIVMLFIFSELIIYWFLYLYEHFIKTQFICFRMWWQGRHRIQLSYISLTYQLYIWQILLTNIYRRKKFNDSVIQISGQATNKLKKIVFIRAYQISLLDNII